MPISRRRFLESSLAGGAFLSGMSARGFSEESLPRGGRLIVGQYPEPSFLTSAVTTAGPSALVSSKIFDGLLSYDLDMNPQPGLATKWSVSPDARVYSFNLRPGVTWHDGKPFGADDVAFSLTDVWRKFHSRGRSTFANLVSVETPDLLTVIWTFSKPAPYILSALASMESQVVPKHIYAGTDILTNPANQAPVGTGPFRFLQWERGGYIALERNPDYWNPGRPYLDQLIFRTLPDAATHAIALETDEIQLTTMVPLNEIARLKAGGIVVDDRDYTCMSAGSGLEFNLDRPYFSDVRVRRAVAHAVDRDFILRNILQGYGSMDTGPIPANQKSFYTSDVPSYPFDPIRAIALLDEAGFKPDAKGIRLEVRLDPLPVSEMTIRLGEYFRSALEKIGIRVILRMQDFSSFIQRVYMDRDFDLITVGGQLGPDPAIGTQRFYWSRNFQKGVAFSNGSHYRSAEADRLLEAAQVEPDPARRRDYYVAFQRVIQTDLPRIPLVSIAGPILMSRQLKGFGKSAEGIYGNFADLSLLPG